jgi:hypothetical protein
MMKRRRRSKQAMTLEERLAGEAHALREQASSMPAGDARESLLRKARQDEVTMHLTEWLTSPGLRPPE